VEIERFRGEDELEGIGDKKIIMFLALGEELLFRYRKRNG
jgi:hypothetical protein